jgi:hypothetical protein
MNATKRNIIGKDYLLPSEEDSYIVSALKAKIIGEPSDTDLIHKLTALIQRQDNEILRVRVGLLKDGDSNQSVLPQSIAEYRAKEIVDSINGDGSYFVLLMCAVNFMAVRRDPHGGNEEVLRGRFLEKNIRTKRSTTPHPGSRFD